MDVSVLDRDRRPVRGLTAEDFSVQEDGKPRKVVAFAEIDLPARPPAPALAWSNTIAAGISTNTRAKEGRLVVIMMDGSIPIGGPTLTARQIAAAAVDQLAPGDLAAVVFASPFAKNGTSQTFTSDRPRLLAAINSPFFGLTIPPEMKDGGLTDGDPHDNDSTCWCGTCLLKAIARVATSVRDVPLRRKSLILIGSGSGIYIQTADVRCTTYVHDARTEMLDALGAANLTIHAFDPTGLETRAIGMSNGRGGLGRSMGQMVDQSVERQSVLLTLAEKTGGRAVTDTNDPAFFVPDAFRESDSYYVLGFERSASRSDRPFHRIDVKVNRRGVDVRTRRGYYDTAETARPAAATTGVDALIAGALPDDGLPLSAIAEPFAAPGAGDPLVAVVVGMTRNAEDARSAQRIDMVAAAFTPEGQSRGGERQTFEIPVASSAAGAGEWTFSSKLPLKPGRYEIRVGLLPAGAPGGSVYVDVVVPDFARAPLSLSGIVLATEPDTLSAPPNLFSNLLPLRPSARREFRSTERARALVRTYQGGNGPAIPVRLTARISGADGRAIAIDDGQVDPNRFSGTRSVDDIFHLPLERLSPGAYLLTIDAVAGPHAARRVLQFVVK